MPSKDIYTSCSDIPIYNFFELIETKNFDLLYKKSGVGGEKYDDAKLSDIFSNILLEYHELTKNNEILREKKEKFDIELMEYRYNLTKELISMYLNTGIVDFVSLLNELGWSIDTEKNVIDQLNAIPNKLKGLKNQLNIKKINFVKRFKKQHEPSPPPNFNLQKQLINLEIGIPLSFKIDMFTDTMERFIFWNEILDNKNKAIRNGKV